MPETKSNKKMPDPANAGIYRQKIECLAALALDFEEI